MQTINIMKEMVFMKNNRYWETTYGKVLSAAIVISSMLLIARYMLYYIEIQEAESEIFGFYNFPLFLISVFTIVNYCINYYKLIKIQKFKGTLLKFLYGFIPCLINFCLYLLAVIY